MRCRFAGAAVVLLVTAAPAQKVSDLRPRGLERGAVQRLEIRGRGLGGFRGLLTETVALEVVKVRRDEDRRVVLDVRVPGEAALGEHFLRVHTLAGLSTIESIHVEPTGLARVMEREPNQRWASAQQIELPAVVAGAIDGSDEDWYRIAVSRGERVTVEVLGARLSRKHFDPALELRSKTGELLQEVDDTALGRMDPWLYIDGDAVCLHGEDSTVVHVVVREMGWGGDSSCRYRLYAGVGMPRPVGAIPAGGPPGREIEVELLDPVLGPWRHKVVLPTTRPVGGVLRWSPERDGLASPSPIFLRVGGAANAGMTDGASSDDAVSVQLPTAVHGVLDEAHETRCFRFAAKKGDRVTASVVARQLRSPLDAVVELRQVGESRVLKSNDDMGDRRLDARFSHAIPADGDYVVEVRDRLGVASDDRFFRLELSKSRPSGKKSEPAPFMRVQIAGRREDVALVVPRGGRSATLLRADRGLPGRDEFELGGLPENVSARIGSSVPGTPFIPIVASADAAAKLVAVGTKPQVRRDGKRLNALFAQSVPHVDVLNRQSWREARSNELPVAIVESAPFAVDVAEHPAVPLLHGSPMDLRVVIERRGFDGPVRIRSLWSPPGLGIGNRTIPAGKNEVVVPMNASANAPLRRWPLVFIAEAEVDGVERRVSTDVVEVIVEDEWFDVSVGRARAELGAPLTLPVTITARKELRAAVCRMYLQGMPNGVAGAARQFEAPAKGAKLEVAWPLRVDPKKARPVRHRNHRLCLELVTEKGTVVQHATGGEIRLDRPRPKTAKRMGGS